jgi:PQQ-dependent catabolism-associated CXXCW motif protein
MRGRRALEFCMVAAAFLWHLVALGAGEVAEPDGYWLGDVNAPVPAAIRGGTAIHVADLQTLLKNGGVVVVDVSNAPQKPQGLAPGAPWMPLPHRALPDALWVPGAGLGVIPPAVDDFYRTRLSVATADNREAPVVVYCHESCWLSWNAAKRAIGYGYRRVYWFSDGIEGWTAAGRPTVIAEPQAPSGPQPPSAVQPPNARQLPRLVVLDIELSGDLGGPEFAAEHTARLQRESARLRQDLERTGLYRILDPTPAKDIIDRLNSQHANLHDCNGCDLEVGRQLHADLVLIAWVNRVSGLILTLTYEIHEVATSRIAARKSFDFRGDNDNAWDHAIDYAMRDLLVSAKADKD